MAMLSFAILLVGPVLLEASGVHDPDVINRVPELVRKSIDDAVARKLQRTVSAHFEQSDYLGLDQETEHETPFEKYHRRLRRDVSNSTTNSTTAKFSNWEEFGECSAKCGGGQQVRYRTCLKGNCREIGSFTEARKCGLFPCVAGSYVLGSIESFGYLPIPYSRMVKFFSIQGARYFGYITDTELHILKWSYSKDGYVPHQMIPVTSGVAFDILNTYPRTYLVVIEKALMIFPGRFSKMYYYDPWNFIFQTTTPVTIDVWEPSAVKTFDVFGTAFLGIVNYKTKMISNYGVTNQLLVCSGETRVASCPAGSIITVASSIYGRVTNYECATGVDIFVSWFQYFATCVVPGAKVKVSKVCDNRQSCQLTADPVNFVDPNGMSCPQTNNYLRITYTCSSISYLGMPIFYKWDGVGLSLISSKKLITYGAKDIESFSIHDQQYIAVANYRNDQNAHHLDSEVYIYNLDNGRFQSLQKIRTDGAVDWEFFTIGTGLASEYFLAVANHIKILPNGVATYELDSVIYKWNWNLFVPFQCIRTYGATKWTALIGEKGRFTLSVSNLYGNTTFYNYDGWRFNKASVQSTDEIFTNSQALYAYKQQDEPMFLVQNDKMSNGTRNLYKTTFMKTFPKHELLENTVRAVQEMNRSVYEIVLPNTKEFNESYKIMKPDIVFLDDVTVTEHKTFRNILVKGNTTVDSANITSITLSSADIQRKEKLNEFSSTISSMYALLDDANEVLADVVTKSTEQVVTSKKAFSYLNATHLNVSGDMNVGLVNAINISDVKENALYLDKNVEINAEFYFRNVSMRDLNVKNKFANIYPRDIVTTDKNEIVSGRKTFSSTKFVGKRGNVNTALLNDIDTADFLTVGDHQVISADYIFGGSTVVGNLSVADKVNGQNMTAVVKDTVMINEPGTVIDAHKEFRKVEVLGDLNLLNNASVNGIDVSDLVKIGLNLAADSFDNTVTFVSNVTFLSNVTVLGTVNGANLDEVVFTNVDSVITAPQLLVGNLETTANIKIDGAINGYSLANLLYTVGNQTVTGKKTFRSNIKIIKDVITSGLVDGVDISDAYARSLLMNTTQNITAYKTFKNLTADNIICYNCNLLPFISFIKNECARESADVVNVTGHKSFNALRVSGNAVTSGSFNDQQMPGDLLIQGRNQTISGNKVFKNNVTVLGNVTVSNVNSVNISEMYHKALPKSNLTIGSKLTFKDNMKVDGNVSVTKAIDDIYLRDVVSTRQDQTIIGTKTFKNDVYVKELYAKKIVAGGLIDGVNVTELEEELLTLSGNKIIKGTKIFERGVSFLGNWSIGSLIDGVNITELYNNAMTLEDDQTITGRKTFVENVHVTDSISVAELVDNENLTDIASHALGVTGSKSQQLITGDVTFENIQLQNDMRVDGLISSVNLSDIVSDTLMTSGNQVITGKHHINNLTVSDVVNVEEGVGGVDLSEEVVPLHRNVTITGTKTFTDNITMTNVETSIVNQLNISNFSKRVAYIDEPTLITGFLVLEKNLTILENLKVSRLINGIDLADVIASTVMKTGDQTIERPIHFKEVEFKDVTNNLKFNGIDFWNFADKIVYKCSGNNQRPITGNWSFKQLEVQGRVNAKNLVVKGNINGVDITLLDNQTVKELGTFKINGLKRIKGDLTVNNITVGTLNGFYFPSDFVGIAGDDIILGKKTFIRDVSVQDAVLRGTLNSINVSEIAKNIVLLGSNEMIQSKVLFKSNVTVNKNLQTESLNGLNVSGEELLLSYGNQTLTASKIFSEVNVEGKVLCGNHINGFDLKKIRNESFISGMENVLKGMISIIGNVYIEGNLKSGSVDGVKNISAQFYGFNRVSSYLRTHIPEIYQSIGITRIVINQLSAAISNVHQSLDYFADMEDLLLPYVSTSIDVVTRESEIWLAAGALSDADGRFCSNTSVFVRSRSPNGNTQFVNKYSIVSNAVTGVKFIERTGSTYLASSSNRKNDGCISDSPNELSMTYLYNSNSNRFQKYASTETYRAAGVYVNTFGDEVTTLFANTYKDVSTCVKQTLHSLQNSSYAVTGFVRGCNVIKSIILTQDNTKTTVAVLGSNSVGYRQLEVFDVLKNGSTFVRQVISTHFASDIIHFTDNGWDYIVIANTYDTSEEALTVSYTVPIAIYRLARNGLYELYQNVKVWAALKIRTLTIGIYNYLVIATYKQEIVILKHKGASKWNVVLTIPIQGYGSIKDLTTWSFDNEVFMAVLSADTWNMRYPSKIRIMKGFLTSSVEGANIIKKVAL